MIFKNRDVCQNARLLEKPVFSSSLRGAREPDILRYSAFWSFAIRLFAFQMPATAVVPGNLSPEKQSSPVSLQAIPSISSKNRIDYIFLDNMQNQVLIVLPKE